MLYRVCSLCVFDESASSSQKNFSSNGSVFRCQLDVFFARNVGWGSSFVSQLIVIDVRTVVVWPRMQANG